MRPHLLLIDALNLIRRIHAAVKATDEDGQVDGAIHACQSSLQRALRDNQPTHALIVFDGNPPTWRHALYPDYKSQRKPMPECLFRRLGDFNSAFLESGVRTFRRSGLEADDVIASIANKAAQAEVMVTILSTDRCYQQLLTRPNLVIRDHFKKETLSADTVLQQHNLRPEQLVDYWAIAGNGDIPGVHGVGSKGAAALLQEYGNLDDILSLENIKGPAAKVCKDKERALLSRQLATLATDLELGVSLKDIRYNQPETTSEHR